MSIETPPPASDAKSEQFTCPACGGQTMYAPGTTSLKCSSCGAEQAITDAAGTIVEHSYDAWAKLAPKPVATIGEQTLKCQNCGATTETDLLADTCQFCSGVLVPVDHPAGLIVPEAVVPFGIDKGAANQAFSKWVKSRRFAPNALKKVGSTEAIKGTYIPHWTYDAQTQTDYSGRRGEHYYETVTRTVSDGNGQSHTETEQVQRTRWYHASGEVSRAFDDVVVRASNQLNPKRLEKAGPWDLAKAVGYRPEYLAGYSALRYDVDPDVGLQDARGQMENVITGDVKHDIGGDEQQINKMNVHYAAVMFKLMLMPLWIASYVFAGKTFQVVVNANTGEVVGERPVSKLKIFLTVLVALIVIAAIIVIVVVSKSHHSSGGAGGRN
jgi:LSD1 subclass zinc finger protein